jgi:hypothetical protein
MDERGESKWKQVLNLNRRFLDLSATGEPMVLPTLLEFPDYNMQVK